MEDVLIRYTNNGYIRKVKKEGDIVYLGKTQRQVNGMGFYSGALVSLYILDKNDLADNLTLEQYKQAEILKLKKDFDKLKKELDEINQLTFEGSK